MSESNLDAPDREAADWFARLGRRSVSTETLEAFDAWRTDRRNADAYARIERLWTDAGRLNADPEIRSTVAEALSRPRARSTTALLRPGLAAAAVLAIGAFAWLSVDSGPAYDTGVGEIRMVSLPDGSQVRLNTRSRVRVRYDRDERRILLEEGQAFFTVATDRSRPFTVEAGEVKVSALGTRFDVRRRPAGAEVILLSGSVRVSAARGSGQDVSAFTLRPGEQVLALAGDGASEAAAKPHPVDAGALTSWTEGRLTFRGTPLPDAVAEVNRYSRRPIVLDAPGLSTVTVTGVFNTGDADAFAAAASDLFQLRIDRSRDDQIRLRDPAAPS